MFNTGGELSVDGQDGVADAVIESISLSDSGEALGSQQDEGHNLIKDSLCKLGFSLEVFSISFFKNCAL